MPTTLKLPTEGTVFRVTGDVNGDAVYKVVNGQITTVASPTYTANTAFSYGGQTYQAGQAAPNPKDAVTYLDPNYRGGLTSLTNAYTVYKNQTGVDANTLPEYNMADIQTALGKGATLGSISSFDINTDPAIAGYTNPNTANPVTGAQQSPVMAAMATNTAPQPFGSNYSPLGVPINPQLGVQPTVSPINSLNSSNLTSPTVQNFQTPTTQTYAPPPMGSYNPPGAPVLQPTGAETQMSDLTKRIMSLNDQYAGKAAYQNDQNNAAGVNAKQGIVNSLTAQRQQILNEAVQIQLQTQQGQGVTTALDQRQRNEALRVNAIAELSISSLLAAANGDLATAQQLADKAVATKFDPIEAEIRAATANLALIRNDPETSRQDLNRANAAQAVLDQQKAAYTQAKNTYEDIQSIAIKAAAAGVDAVTLQKIQNATSAVQAAQLAAQWSAANPTAQTTSATNTTTTPAGLQSGKTFVSGTIQYTPQQFTTDKAQLVASRGSDGWVDPAVYLRGYNAWIQGGGLKSDFLQIYPIKDYINPVNTWPEIVALGGGTQSGTSSRSI